MLFVFAQIDMLSWTCFMQKVHVISIYIQETCDVDMDCYCPSIGQCEMYSYTISKACIGSCLLMDPSTAWIKVHKHGCDGLWIN